MGFRIRLRGRRSVAARPMVLVLASCFLLACSTPPPPFEQVLPASAEGWNRTQITEIQPAAAPDLVKQLGVKRAVAATYAGPASVDIRVYEMNVATSAFELIQKWRQQDGLAIYKDAYFVIAAPASPPQARDLLEMVRKHLP